jgi:hypothetical protein
VYKKNVIALQRAIVRELPRVWTFFYHFEKSRILAIDWHVFHAKWEKK